MRFKASVCAAALLLTFAAIARADTIQTIQVSVNSEFEASFDSPSDSWWGWYSTTSDLPAFAEIYSGADTTSPSFSLSLPAGSVVLGAYVLVQGPPPGTVTGSGALVAEEGFEPPDPSAPSIAPTFTGNGGSLVQQITPMDDVFFPTIDGDEIYVDSQNIDFLLQGSIFDSISTPGSNWNGFIGGSGEAEIPYTLQLNVEYSPTPEPSSIALLGTAFLGVAEIARRKLARG
jgi:hypothetical protein